MKELLISFILMIAGMAAIVMLGAKYSQWLLSRSVGAWIEQAQSIAETGKPPDRWRREWRRSHFWVRSPARLQLNLAANDINRLTRLMRLVDSSPAFGDGDTREGLLRTLEVIQREWHRAYQDLPGAR